jgi:hypothetical protein
MKNLTSKLIVVVASAIVIVGCGKSSPAGPSPFGNPGVENAFNLRGEVAQPSMEGDVPAEGVTALISNGSLQTVAVTDGQGRFAVEGISAGDWTIVLSKTGYMDQTLQVTVTADAYVSCLLERDPSAVELKKPARIR